MPTVTRGQDVVVADLRIANNMLTRMVGLGFIRDFQEGRGLLLAPCNSVHTMWPAFPIDVVFLAQDGRILRICPEMPHKRFSPIVWAAASVLELPAGTSRKFGLETGQILTVQA
jgi:uncharacterized membrane protein (UPF0127 family)